MSKNLCCRGPIDAEALRQRRDFYSLSIGLLLFYLADGNINSDSTFGMLPLHFENAKVFLYAAWTGWVYFLLRYWLHTDNIFSDFKEELDWQATDTWFARKLICKLAEPQNDEQKNYLRMCFQKKPLLCKLSRIGFKFRIELNSMGFYKGGSQYSTIFQSRWELQNTELGYYFLAKLHGMFKALYKERTFTNYILPYVFGLFTLIVFIVKKTNFVLFLQNAFTAIQNIFYN